MAKLPNAFAEENHGEMGDYPVIPKDTYHLMIEDTDYRKNKREDGSFLEIKLKVMAGDYAGHVLFRYLNLDHPKQNAMDMANKELASIMRAVGIAMLDDSEELHGKELMADVVVQKGKDENPDRNEIKKYHALDGDQPRRLGADDEDEDEKPQATATKRRPVFEDD